METQTVNGIYPVIKISGFFISPDDIVSVGSAYGGKNNQRVWFVVVLRFNIYETKNYLEIGESCFSDEQRDILTVKYNNIANEIRDKWQSYLNEL